MESTQTSLGREELSTIADKLHLVLKNSLMIRDKSRHLPALTNMRGLDVLARLCKAEAEDHHNLTISKNRNDIRLGKRQASTHKERIWEYDAKKFLSVTSLVKPAQRGPFIPSSTISDSKPTSQISTRQLEEYRAVLEVIATDLHKLRHIKRIHKMKQSKGSSSSSKATGIFEIGMQANTKMIEEMQGLDISGLPELDVMLIEVVIRSGLSLDDKMVFLWDTLSEEYDKDTDSKYMEYQELILTKLEESPDLRGKISPRAWEDFIKKLPKINRRVLDHIWAITKQDKNSTLMYEVSRFAKKEIRDIAVNYMLEMGK